MVDLTRPTRFLVAGGALLYIGVYGLIALLRLRYPFELQWMEGAVLDHVYRVGRGEPIYVAPSLAFIPFLYTPLYYYLSAALGVVVGEGFFPMRLLSFIASLVTHLTIFAIVARESRSRFAALLAMGLFAATYPLGGYWFDLGRVDSLFLAFFLVGLYLIRFHGSAAAAAAAALLFALSFFTKQTALPLALPLILWLLWQRRRQGGIALLIFASCLLLGTWWLDRASAGWFSFYVFEMPSQPYHLAGQVTLTRAITFWTHDLIKPLAGVMTLVALYLLTAWEKSRERYLFYALFVGSSVGVTWYLRAHGDADLNDLFPAYAALAILFGIAVADLLARVGEWPLPPQRLGRQAIYLLLLFQFISLAYDPFAQLPTEADLAAGERVVALIRQIEGDVFVPYHSYLSVMAGKPQHAHAIPIGDMIRSGLEPERSLLIAETERAIQQQHFAAILLDDRTYLGGFDLEEHYALDSVLFDEDDQSFLPKTGYDYRPLYLLRPR